MSTEGFEVNTEGYKENGADKVLKAAVPAEKSDVKDSADKYDSEGAAAGAKDLKLTDSPVGAGYSPGVGGPLTTVKQFATVGRIRNEDVYEFLVQQSGEVVATAVMATSYPDAGRPP